MRGVVRIATLAVLVAATFVGLPRADARLDLGEVLGVAVERLGLGEVVAGDVRTIATTAESLLLTVDDGAGAALVRRHGPEGWGEWVEVQAAPDEAPDDGAEGAAGSARTVLGPVWLGQGTNAVQVQAAEGGSLPDLGVELLDDLLGDLEAQLRGLVDQVLAPLQPLQPDPGAPSEPGPPIHSAASWGSPGWSYSTPTCEEGPKTAPLTLAVVHHTVQANGYGPDDVPAMLRSIYYGHLARGWCDVGYNFLVDSFGRIWQGRNGPVDRAVVGGHARGYNTGSIGVALLGQHHPGASPPPAMPTDAAIAGARAVIDWQFRIHGAPRHVVGHRDVGATACPGDWLYGRV